MFVNNKMYTKIQQQGNSFPTHQLVSILKKMPNNSSSNSSTCSSSKKSVIFNENLNIFYESNDCLCWLNQLEQQQQQQQHEHGHEYNEIEQPTLSPPEGYKDKIFNLNYQHMQQQQQQYQQQQIQQHPHLLQQQHMQQMHQQQMQQQQQFNNPDVTHGNPPSPPSAKRKIFLYNNQPVIQRENTINEQQLQTEEEEEENEDDLKRRGLRLGGILKGGRLWRSNSSDNKKSPEEPDLLKCIETKCATTNTGSIRPDVPVPPQQIQKISIGTTPLSTSEQIRLAVTMDTKQQQRKIHRKQTECSSLVEKLRWLTSLDDDDENGDDLDNSINYSTWPSRDNKLLGKKDAGTSTSIETDNEIKQLNNYKIDDNELINFIDINRINKIKKQYNDTGGDDYGFSHRPSVKGIKNKFAKSMMEQYNAAASSSSSTPTNNGSKKEHEQQGIMVKLAADESQYENLNTVNNHKEQLMQMQMAPPAANDLQIPIVAPPPPSTVAPMVMPAAPGSAATPATPTSAASVATGNNKANNQQQPQQTSEFKTNFQIIRQSFENNSTRPYSWSTLPTNHQHLMQQQQQNHQQTQQHQQKAPQPLVSQQQLNLHLNSQQSNQQYYGTLQPKSAHTHMYATSNDQQQQQQQQPIYGTIRRVPNVIGRPLFLHYTALSVEAHPNKIIYPKPMQQQQQQQQQQSQQVGNKLNDTSPTIQQQLTTHYYGPPIRYYNQPPAPPVIPTMCNNLSSNNITTSTSTYNYNIQPVYTHPHVNVLMCNNPEDNLLECRGIPEGRDETDDEYK